MLYVYLFEIKTKPEFTIDLSKIPTSRLADECDSILDHHKESIIFFGFLIH
jgi:hypothetical protein